MATQSNCENALDTYEEYLSALPNVVGLGIVSGDESEPDSRSLAVGVYVSKKMPKETLNEEDLIPEYLDLTKGNKQTKVPVRIIEQGPVTKEEDTIGRETL